MNVVKIQGGLGNQLFQWALSRYLMLEGYDTYIDISQYSNQQGMTQRAFQLSVFPNCKYKLLSDFLQNNNHSNINLTQMTDDFVYKNLSVDNIYLNGYWQSEKYFKKYEDIIREELIPSSEIQFKLLEKYNDLNSNSVSLHVRRGDYVRQQGHHPLQPIEYYKNAIIQIGDYDVLYIFSDDIQWCMENLNFKNMVFVNNDSDEEDIWHMSMCKHNIIANSSFSWWGAWLNSNPDKKVITPITWFGPNIQVPTNDIIPNEWIKL